MNAQGEAFALDRLRFRVAATADVAESHDLNGRWSGVRFATRDTNGEVWADFAGGSIRHGNVVGTRRGSSISSRSAFVTTDGVLGSYTSTATIAPNDGHGIEIVEHLDVSVDEPSHPLAGGGTRTLEQIGLRGTLLFICTGNFYRSRFAELYFEHRCEAKGLDWVAESRGLRGWDTGARGRMSPATIDQLRECGVPVPYVVRSPHLTTPTDIEAVTRVIALDGTEHRPLIRQWLSKFEDRIEYWEVPDVDRVDPSVALPAIIEHVDLLIGELSQPDPMHAEPSQANPNRNRST